MSVRHPGLRRALTRPAAALAALTVATSALLVAGTAAPAAAQATTSLVITPYRSQRTVGQVQEWIATLSTGSTRLPGKQIVFYVRPTTTTTWTKYETKTTNSNGQIGMSFPVRRSTYVLAKFLGTTDYAGSKSGGALVTAVDPIGVRAVREASTHQGKPYQWGAAGPSRFDCSGFTLYVWSRLGKSLPHNSRQQYGVVRHIAKSSMQVGDLVFIYNSSGIYHVGIYAGSNTMWHSPHSGDVVKRSTIYTSSYYVGRVA
ncbi:MAG TPA: NlpC/P60 family protein [Mycobacteriales bacterium]|jgi:cell wall-associated NlpC family hydrolase|nr:NlpC/P60 family protein [Mycobacteriales bacterium]